MQIELNAQIFLFTLAFILTKQIYLYLIFILFTLAHELTHMLVGILLGFKPQKFCIMPFGFKIIFKEYGKDRELKIKRLIVELSGPAFNLMAMSLGIIFKLNSSIIYSNLIIAIFNLIPIYPLDGGKILATTLSLKLAQEKILKIINQTSNVTIIILTIISSIAILYIHNIAIIVAITFLWILVIRENKKYRIFKKIYEEAEKNIDDLSEIKN